MHPKKKTIRVKDLFESNEDPQTIPASEVIYFNQ